MNEFSEWLTQELESRKLGISDLARIAHVTRGAIGNVLRGERNPGPELCTAIARGLHLPQEEVFRRAGLLLSAPVEDIEIAELDHIARQLDDENKNELIRYARMKLEIQEERSKYHVEDDNPSGETSKP
jgi:transcriptional regulator with XRE-family HTH domain